MARHPDAQKRAQKELDNVLGPHELPSFEHRARTPYVESLLKEVIRWGAPVTFGAHSHPAKLHALMDLAAMPHRLTRPDVYKGFIFPEGTLVSEVYPRYMHLCLLLVAFFSLLRISGMFPLGVREH